MTDYLELANAAGSGHAWAIVSRCVARVSAT